MYIFDNPIKSSEVSTLFNLELVGKDRSITRIATTDFCSEDSIGWIKNDSFFNKINQGVIICKRTDFGKVTLNDNITYLITDISPRLVFSKVIHQIYPQTSSNDFVNKVEEHRRNTTLKIGENVFIACGVIIGDHSVIHHNVSIYSNSKIGSNCVIQSNTSIGTEGLGLDLDIETNLFVKFPQLGGVILEDFVEVGPNSTIRRAALNNTIIKRGTKIGALCNIGHNSIIGENCILTCNIITSGSSVLGDNVFMGVGSSLKQGVCVSDNVIIGQGTVVLKNIPEGETWIGNPAKKRIN